MWALKRDPVTGDFIKDGRGGWVKTNTAENLVRNQLKAKLGLCWQDSELGSLLHDRGRFQVNPPNQIKDETERALARVVNAGRISNLEVKVVAPKAGRVDGTTRFIDVSSGSVVSTKIPVGR